MASTTPSGDEPPTTAASGNWRFTWEAQSRTPILRLLLFKPGVKPSAQCRDLKLSLLPEKSFLELSFWESDVRMEAIVRVPLPRVLVDPEAALQVKAFDDHIEVKLVLLLPVDHPIVSEFDSILNFEEKGDALPPLSLDSDLKKLSLMKEVHFYCRNCSFKLTKGLSCFEELPSVNWRDVADNWFGNCCCSFVGVSEKLVAKYAKSYTCAPGLCFLNPTSVLLSKDDLLGCSFSDAPIKQSHKSDLHSQEHVESCSSLRNSFDDSSLASVFPTLKIDDKIVVANEKSHTECCHGKSNAEETPGTTLSAEITKANAELLETQKVFLNGYLGNGFMVRSSGLSNDIRWVEFCCPDCSCLIGAYPCVDDNAPLDGGIRLFKCCVSTCVPCNLSDDAFKNYTLERMFASQLLESAEDELSYRTIVRDIRTKSSVLQIILLNPNSWSCCSTESAADKLVMLPSIKVLFSASAHDTEHNSRTLEDWVRKNQADEIYMFSTQIHKIIRILEEANSLYPPSCASLQGLSMSSLRR
ncbi:uncharacterized protein LOC127258565 [Andrographis paniculata]|uniref:uncharacterized protein LOC127258565 n=1 Tax=Andrographis paniculata TaxID=175694 RepID=UPI0021E94839|nr:uncharacterized protein LOC127258565 [Andrographis paniculata]XP_051141401.1 uncharacterized protein LOC127258565 [Andrographis paniculata]XP_051141402.1 uncharacterized protein LOC127258565 [Andrographis paniculata]XP_051141403.1 uncharacterized protein LOC127258565 [Andrographis paniculata]